MIQQLPCPSYICIYAALDALPLTTEGSSLPKPRCGWQVPQEKTQSGKGLYEGKQSYEGTTSSSVLSMCAVVALELGEVLVEMEEVIEIHQSVQTVM